MTALAPLARAWYVFEYVRELVLVYPVYAIMIGDAGVSPVGLSVLLFVWSATAIVLEVPTGALADHLPRPPLIALGLVFKAIGFVCWWQVPSFGGFLLGFVLWGMGSALRSGTAESLLYDHLVARGHADRFEEVYGRGEAAHSAGALSAMVAGGWLASGGYGLPLVLSSITPCIAAAVVLLAIGDAPRAIAVSPRARLRDTLILGLREVRSSRPLRLPLVLLCTVVVAYEAGEEYFGPWLREQGFTLRNVGFGLAALLLAHIVGASLAQRLQQYTWPIRTGFAAAAVALLIASRVDGLALLASLGVFVGLIAAGKILLQGRIQRAIRGHARATVTSAAGMAQELVSLGVFLGIGAVAARSSWSTSFSCLGVALLTWLAILAVGAGRGRFQG